MGSEHYYVAWISLRSANTLKWLFLNPSVVNFSLNLTWSTVESYWNGGWQKPGWILQHIISNLVQTKSYRQYSEVSKVWWKCKTCDHQVVQHVDVDGETIPQWECGQQRCVSLQHLSLPGSVLQVDVSWQILFLQNLFSGSILPSDLGGDGTLGPMTNNHNVEELRTMENYFSDILKYGYTQEWFYKLPTSKL